MTSQPWWRQAVDAAEQSIGPRIDGFLRSDVFAQLLRTSLELRATTLRRVEPYSRTLLHALNLPTASDVRMIRRQVANLERQLVSTEPPVSPARRTRRPAHGSPARSRSG